MPLKTEDESLITDYLLGELSEEEQAQVEESYLRDPEYREAIRSTEDDLVDQYVRGELPPREHALFEKSLAALPRRRQEVEFARALAAALPEAPYPPKSAAEGRSPRPFLSSIFDFWRYRKLALGFSFAVMLLLAVGGLWLVNEARRARARQERLEAERRPGSEPGQQTARHESQREGPGEEQPTPEAVRPQPSPARPARTPEPGKPGGPTAGGAAVASFVFGPGMTRGGEGGRQLLVPEGTRVVRLRLDLERGDEYPSYVVELSTAAGRPVWRRAALPGRRHTSGPSVSVDIPATILAPGEYELKLAGSGNEGPPEEIGYYYFRLLKR